MKEKYVDANWHYPEKGEYPVAFGEYKQKVYPQIPCLVFHRGRYGVRFWNCIEECWDEEDGDDFFCSKDSVEEWMYIDALEQEQPANMIQWTGSNLREVIDFTGKSPKFDEWFKSWEDFENYVHSHGDILKLFCEDGSHFEVPVGAWIVKTPDGYNVPSVAKFIPAKQEQPDADLEEEVKRWWNERYSKVDKNYKFDSTSGHYLDNEGIIDLARYFAEWGAVHLNAGKEE